MKKRSFDILLSIVLMLTMMPASGMLTVNGKSGSNGAGGDDVIDSNVGPNGENGITDYCPNVDNKSTTHEKVLENADKVSSEFMNLVKTIVKKL